MASFKNFFKQHAGGIISGLLVGTSYIPFPPWALLFCWLPLWMTISQNRSWKTIAISAWISQFLLALIGFHWVGFVAHEYAFLPWVIAIPVLLAYAAFFHLHFVFAALIAAMIRRRSRTLFFVLTAPIWFLFETFFPQIFPWNLGYPLLFSRSSWIQIADVIGFSGLSFFVYLIQGLLLFIWLRHTRRAAFAATIVIFFGFFYGGEAFRHRADGWANPSGKTEVLLVQANIPNIEKALAENYSGTSDIARAFFNLTDAGMKEHPETELVIWPETAFPDYLDRDYELRPTARLMRSYLVDKPFSILTGAFSAVRGASSRSQYNAVFYFGPHGLRTTPPYHKTQLLIFGEYVPLGKYFPFLKNLNPGGPGWDFGTGPQVVHEQGGQILGPQICYEGLDPAFSRELALLGADYFVNVTNDSWFGDTAENRQHLYMTFARALEFRRPLIRSTNTGISGVILATGEVKSLSPSFRVWTEHVTVPYQPHAPQTFYANYGFFLPYLVLLVTLMLAAFLFRRRSPAVKS